MPFTGDVREDGSVHMNSQRAQTLLVHPIHWSYICCVVELSSLLAAVEAHCAFCKLELLSYS